MNISRKAEVLSLTDLFRIHTNEQNIVDVNQFVYQGLSVVTAHVTDDSTDFNIARHRNNARSVVLILPAT